MFRSPPQFIREQGVNDADVGESLYNALMFLPRSVRVLLAVGMAPQRP